MKAVSILCLSGAFALAAFSAVASDWRKERCKEYLDLLEASLEDGETEVWFNDREDEDVARYSYLSYQERFLRLKASDCIGILYHYDKKTSTHEDNDGREWEEAWSR